MFKISFLNENVNLRLRDIEGAELNLVLEKNPEIFENKSHFVRCAIIRYLREWREDKKEELGAKNENNNGTTGQINE